MPQIFHHIKSQITYIPLSVYCSLKGKLCNVVHVVKYVLLVIHFLMIQVQRYLLKIENMECIWDLIKKQYLKFTNWLGFKDFRYKWFCTAWLALLYGKRLLLVAVIMTICISFIMSCSSCSTPKPVVLERTLHDTVYVNNLRLDSFLLISADVLRKSMELRLPRWLQEVWLRPITPLFFSKSVRNTLI